MIDPSSDPKAAQEVVDSVAEALSNFEAAIMRALGLFEAVREAVAEFQTAIDTHWTYVPYGEIAEASGHVGRAFSVISEAHRTLDKLRKAKGFPEPGAEQRNGSGGGKP